MAVGQNISKADIDGTSAALTKNVNNALARCVDFKAWLDTQPDQDLITTYGYTAGEVAVLKSAFTDLANLAATYRGERTQPEASDFRFFAKQLMGFGF